MELLDQIISGYSAPRIVSEVHDTNQIDYGGAAAVSRANRRPSGPWDAAEYGITLEQAQAAFDAADTPEKRAQVIEDLKVRAIRRANLDVSNGRVNVMTVGKPPWHGLGVNVAEATTASEARRLAGLQWTMSKVQLGANFQTTSGEHVYAKADCWGIVRDDTGKVLGTTGSKYRVIQNDHGTDFLDSVLGEFGAKYHTAGSIGNGEKVWLQVALPNQSFTLPGGDENQAFATFLNYNDGSAAARCFATENRVVCGNTFRVEALRNRHKGLSIRHTGNIQDKVKSAREALGLAIQGFDTFKESAEAFATIKAPPIREYADNVLDMVLDVSAAQVRTGSEALTRLLNVDNYTRELQRQAFEKKIEKRKNVLADIVERYDSAHNASRVTSGTLWNAFNAVTDHADHYQGGRRVGTLQERAERRFESSLSGSSDELKQAAYSQATAIVR